MSKIEKDLGAASAYAYAVEQGYTGTEEEFAELMADYAAVEQRAAQSATAAQGYSNNASQSASASAQSAYQALASATAAGQSAETASTKASEASNSAQNASAKATEASGYASTASTKASEASQSASTASGHATAAGQAKTAAETAQAAAEQAQTDAESAKDDAESARDAAQGYAESIDPDEIDAKIYAVYATDTATGTVASFSDGADDIPMKDVKVQIEPVQDLNGYDRPWAGGSGKNILENNVQSGTLNTVTITRNDDGTLIVNGSTTKSTVIIGNFATGTYGAGSNQNDEKKHIPNGQYIFSTGLSSGTGVTLQVCASNISGVSDTTIIRGVGTTTNLTIDDTYAYNWVRLTLNSGTYDNVLVKPMICLASETDTSYSPYENICPITGWTGVNVSRTGKNLFDESNVTFASWTDSSGNDTGNTSGCVSDYICISAPQTVTVMFNGVTPYSASIIEYTSNKEFIIRNHRTWTGNSALLPLTVSLNTDTKYIRVQVYSTGTGVVQTSELLASEKIQLEFGSTATDYEPYAGDTYSITFPTEAGTVYGGTLDVTTGELVIDRVMASVGTLSWGKQISEQAFPYFIASSVNDRKAGSTKLLGSIYKPASGGRNTITADCMIATYNTTNSKSIVVRDDAYMDEYAFKAARNDVQIVYELAEPIHYTLTPTEITSLLGTNNIWADTGDSTVEYRADTKLYINKKITEAVSALS